LFTVSSKAKKTFHNSIKEHVECKKKKERKEKKHWAPTGFDPGTSGLKISCLTACAKEACLKLSHKKISI
jgi:hypothetical protein